MGLAVARGCAVESPLFITDQLEMHALMELNIKLNHLDTQAEAKILNWSVYSSLLRLPWDSSYPVCKTMPGARQRRSQRIHAATYLLMLTHTLLTCYRGEPLPKEIVDFKPDVILAADCVYFEPAFPLLLATLTDLLKLCPSATIYFCFKKRRRADMQFLKKAQKMFKVAEVADDDRPIFSREGLFLYTFKAL